MSQQAAPAGPAPATGYFVDQRKGEVNELKQLLKNINVERDTARKRDVLKKVIAYMTLGIDVSRLFTDMIMAIETKDVVVKKMVYLYLCNYAHKEPEMAIMCINSLRRECDNEDPMVRGLALRSLCNLRLESILEYIELPLQKSLQDMSAYVRKTGVLGILKVSKLSPGFIESRNYVTRLYEMLDDVDTIVVTNVLIVLSEILIDEGGIPPRQPIIMSLLNRLGEFNEWGFGIILELVSKYTPTSEDELFSIMNILDPVLRTASSSAVLATLKCFMKLSQDFPPLEAQIYARSKPPMLTLINVANNEIQNVMLEHLKVILHRRAAKGIFDDEYRQFFVRYNESQNVKYLKVSLLPLLANDINVREIASELKEYVSDVDIVLSKHAIRSMGSIAASLPSQSAEVVTMLVELLDLDINHVRSETITNLATILRIFPALSSLVLPAMGRCFKHVDESDAKAAMVWMLGEFGSALPEAPYMLEPLIDNYDEEASAKVKLQLLTATMNLFFTRAPEVRGMLGRLLSYAIDDSTHQHVHDAALLYYRTLSANFQVCEQLIRSKSAAMQNVSPHEIAEYRDADLDRKIYTDFDTLAIMFSTTNMASAAD